MPKERKSEQLTVEHLDPVAVESVPPAHAERVLKERTLDDGHERLCGVRLLPLPCALVLVLALALLDRKHVDHLGFEGYKIQLLNGQSLSLTL